MAIGFHDVVDSLVAVIDLKDGAAVHAIAGQRNSYEGVVLADGTTCSDPVRLASHYRSLGVKQLYIADLDGIVGKRIQREKLVQMLDAIPDWQRVLLDVGCASDSGCVSDSGCASDSNVHQVASQICASHPQVSFVVASESASSPFAIAEMSQAIGAQRTVAGLDFRAGAFVARDQSDEADFLAASRAAGVSQTVVLDVSAVGTKSTDAAVAVCNKVRTLDPEITIYSGGGISSADDAQMLMRAGSDYCLVATWLHGMC